jgi:hypothetical protein
LHQTASLFDHLVGAGKQRQRDGEAKRPGGFEVDDQFNFGSRWTSRSAGFSPWGIRPVQTPAKR